MNKSGKWIIVDTESGKKVDRLGIHESRESAESMLDLQLSLFDVDIRDKFVIHEIQADDSESC